MGAHQVASSRRRCEKPRMTRMTARGSARRCGPSSRSHIKKTDIYDLYYRRKEVSNELYEFCLDQGYADRNLIVKWKKPGHEHLCCLRCMQPHDHNFHTTCVSRVPKHLRGEKVIECFHCGCGGCATGD